MLTRLLTNNHPLVTPHFKCQLPHQPHPSN
jgi:hypothetical protein